MFWRRNVSLAAILTLLFSASAEAGKEKTAKDLFLDQSNNQSESINTGVQYWIEVMRNGRSMRVDNTHAFKSGDRLRFHIIPDVDGYAYIAMVKGSSGKKSVLFPVPGRGQSNKVTHGKKVVLPPAGYLVLDNKPGDEKLRLALSRNPIDATALLNDNKPWAQIASRAESTQVPENYVVSYAGEDVVVAETPKASEGNTEASGTEESVGEGNFSKDLFYEDAKPRRRTASRRSTGTVKRRYTIARKRKRPPAAATEPPAVIVLNTDPAQELLADITINHR